MTDSRSSPAPTLLLHFRRHYAEYWLGSLLGALFWGGVAAAYSADGQHWRLWGAGTFLVGLAIDARWQWTEWARAIEDVRIAAVREALVASARAAPAPLTSSAAPNPDRVPERVGSCLRVSEPGTDDEFRAWLERNRADARARRSSPREIQPAPERVLSEEEAGRLFDERRISFEELLVSTGARVHGITADEIAEAKRHVLKEASASRAQREQDAEVIATGHLLKPLTLHGPWPLRGKTVVILSPGEICTGGDFRARLAALLGPEKHELVDRLVATVLRVSKMPPKSRPAL